MIIQMKICIQLLLISIFVISTYSCGLCGSQSKLHGITRIEEPEDRDKRLVSVIITIRDSSSYDNLFTKVPQKPKEGKIVVYSVSHDAIPRIFQRLKGEPSTEEVLETMISEIRSLNPDCVVFNFECSSGYSHKSFRNSQQTLEFVKYLLDNKHMIMFGDFSLKALINEWKEDLLGPNPFYDIGETSGKMKLFFDPQDLITSPSKQLEMVGTLSRGELEIATMGGTIVFGYDNQKSKNDIYDFKVLTITDIDKREYYDRSYQINLKRGTLGHAMLKYKSGGIIIVSAGHWIQLQNIDLDETKFKKVVEDYGGDIQKEYDEINSSSEPFFEKRKKYREVASKIIQSNSPSNYQSKEETVSNIDQKTEL